jgi:hypothetical protein
MMTFDTSLASIKNGLEGRWSLSPVCRQITSAIGARSINRPESSDFAPKV